MMDMGRPLHSLAARDEVYKDYNEGNDEQDMNEPADGGPAHDAEQPKHEQNYCDCV
jgi:hypothetical protein